MKKITLLLLLALSLGACSTSQTHRGPASAFTQFTSAMFETNESVNKDIQSFQLVVEEALVWRVKATEFYQKVAPQLKNRPFTALELEKLYNEAEHYLEIRERLYQFARKYESFADEAVGIPEAPAERQLYLKQLKLSLSAALVLYDNYIIGIHPYFDDDKFRRKLNKDRPGLEGKIYQVNSMFMDMENRRKTAFGVAWARKQYQEIGYAALDVEEKWLDSLVVQSPSYGYFMKNSSWRTAAGFRYLLRWIRDELRQLGKMLTYVTSALFGNAMGLVEERKGWMNDMKDRERAALAARMEPLDVLMEKTPFRLTDKFIPGHYGHVAIWVGTETDLQRLGIWDHELVKPHQEAIRSGHHIVEALRPGVQINTLKHFLNIDDFLAVRHTGLTDEMKKNYLLKTFQQIGKDYDFNFDVETDRRIVCSEIAYVVYRDVDWPTDKQMGRHTISPDNVVTKATDRNPFTPVVLYHDGVEVKDNLEETVKLFLAEDYEGFRKLHPGFVGKTPPPAPPPSDPWNGGGP